MADKNIRIGSQEGIHTYDDADYPSSIKTDGPMEAGAPVNPTEVVRLIDLGTYTQGPASATDNAVARFDGTTGKILQNSLVTIDDSGSQNIPTGQGYKVAGIKVVTDQQAVEADVGAVSAISLGAGADTVDIATFNAALVTLVAEINAIKTKLNNVLAKLRTHGLINT